MPQWEILPVLCLMPGINIAILWAYPTHFLTLQLYIMGKNWKTTAWGVGVILTAVGGALVGLFDNDPNTLFDFTSTIAAIGAGIGLITAKDGDAK